VIQTSTETFEIFWHTYPKRQGRRVGKRATLELFKRIDPKEHDNLLLAVKHYAECQQCREGYAKDPERFLRRDYWMDWIDEEEEQELMERYLG